MVHGQPFAPDQRQRHKPRRHVIANDEGSRTIWFGPQPPAVKPHVTVPGQSQPGSQLPLGVRTTRGISRWVFLWYPA
jgi:hypothetical protein